MKKNLHNVIDVAFKIKFSDCKNKFVRIRKIEKDVYASLVSEKYIDSKEYVIDPKLFLDPTNYNEDNNEILNKEPSISQIVRLLRKFMILWR